MDASSPVFSGANVLTRQEWQDWINRVKEQISRPLMSAPTSLMPGQAALRSPPHSFAKEPRKFLS